jgi:hypothetical protein
MLVVGLLQVTVCVRLCRTFGGGVCAVTTLCVHEFLVERPSSRLLSVHPHLYNLFFFGFLYLTTEDGPVLGCLGTGLSVGGLWG